MKSWDIGRQDRRAWIWGGWVYFPIILRINYFRINFLFLSIKILSQYYYLGMSKNKISEGWKVNGQRFALLYFVSPTLAYTLGIIYIQHSQKSSLSLAPSTMRPTWMRPYLPRCTRPPSPTIPSNPNAPHLLFLVFFF